MLPFQRYLGPKGEKWPKVFPWQNSYTSLLGLKFFLQKLETNWDVSFFLFGKYRSWGWGEPNYWWYYQKMHFFRFFLIVPILWYLVKFLRKNIFERKKKTHSNLFKVFTVKIWARSVGVRAENRGENFIFLLKKTDFEKNAKKFVFFGFFTIFCDFFEFFIYKMWIFSSQSVLNG